MINLDVTLLENLSQEEMIEMNGGAPILLLGLLLLGSCSPGGCGVILPTENEDGH